MANRNNTFLLKRSNVAGKVPVSGDLKLGELAINTADGILYASGTTANSILPIGWDRVARTGDTMTGSLYAPSISATTISATTYLNLPSMSGSFLPLSGGTVTGTTYFTNGLSANTLSAITIQFDTTYTGTVGAGQIAWDANFGTLQQGLVGGNVIQKIGETSFALVKNVESTTLNKGEVVYIFGATGDKISVKRACNTGDTTSSKTLGVVAESIASNQNGLVITQGTLDGLNLGAYSAGTVLWLSSTPGAFTDVKQYAPNHLVFIGVVQRANNGNGQLYVKPQNGYEIDELHNVLATGATYGDLLVYSAYNGNDIWVSSKNLNGSYTMTGLTVNGNLTVTGNTFVSGSSTTVGDVRGFSLVSTQSIGDEGGEIRLSTAQTNNSLSGGSITFDVYQNRLRFFESGGSNRGVYIDLTAAATGVGTNLLSGGGGEINTASNLGSGTGLFAQKSAADLQFKSLTSTGGTVTISNDANTVNLEVVPASNFTGGTVTGPTLFTNGLTANTISATTYYNLPISTDTFVTGATYSNNTFTYTNNTGGTFNTLFNTVTGLTVNGNLTVTGGTQSWFSGNSSSDLVRITQTGSGNALVVEDANNPDSSPFVVNPSGNVGIGTTTPAAKFEIKSAAQNNLGGLLLRAAASANYPALIYETTNQSGVLELYSGSTLTTQLHANGNNFLNGGNVGIGVIAPTAKLHINNSGSGNSFLVEDSNNPDSTPFVIDNNGIVGVGTTSPSGFNARLVVIGTTVGEYGVRSTGNLNHGMLGNASLGYAGVYGLNSNDGIGTGIGVYGRAEFADTPSSGQIWIGGKFEAAGDPVGASYSVQLIDNTEGINKVLVSQTSDGKANWSSVLSGLTGVYTNTISATTYQNLPTDVFVTGGTYSNGTATFTNNTGGTFTVTGIGSTGSNVGSGTTIFSGTSGSTLIFKSLTSTASTITIQGNAQTVNLETNAGVKVIPIATSSTAIGTGSNDYYINFKVPYNFTISKIDFSVSTAGSDSVRIGIYRGQDLSAVLVGQSAGGTVSTLNSVSIIAESGQNLHFKAGEWMVIGVAVGGTTTNLFGMACPANNLVAWTNTTDSTGGFPTNPRSKAGTRTSFPSIEINIV